MIISGGQVWIWKELFIAYFKVLPGICWERFNNSMKNVISSSWNECIPTTSNCSKKGWEGKLD
jgi:hypothetical protein